MIRGKRFLMGMLLSASIAQTGFCAEKSNDKKFWWEGFSDAVVESVKEADLNKLAACSILDIKFSVQSEGISLWCRNGALHTASVSAWVSAAALSNHGLIILQDKLDKGILIDLELLSQKSAPGESVEEQQEKITVDVDRALFLTLWNQSARQTIPLLQAKYGNWGTKPSRSWEDLGQHERIKEAILEAIGKEGLAKIYPSSELKHNGRYALKPGGLSVWTKVKYDDPAPVASDWVPLSILEKYGFTIFGNPGNKELMLVDLVGFAEKPPQNEPPVYSLDRILVDPGPAGPITMGLIYAYEDAVGNEREAAEKQKFAEALRRYREQAKNMDGTKKNP